MIKFSRRSVDDQLKSIRRAAEERDAERRAAKEKLPYLDLKGQAIDRGALEFVAEDLARSAKAIPFKKDKKKISLAVFTSKSDEVAKLMLSLEEKQLSASFFVSSLSSLEEAWREYSSVRVEGREEIVSEIRLTEGTLQARGALKSIVAAIDDIASVNPDMSTTDILVLILADAVNLGVSDIHLESGRTNNILRFRLDGIMHEVAKFPEEIQRRLVGRLKLLSKLKLNIKDQPQDGRFTIRRQGGDIEARVSVVPAEYGESVVMRVLDPKAINLKLSELGLRSDDEQIVQEAIRQPNGMILVTGPTGSGKTTSLYTFLRVSGSPDTKTITIEDPIEYHLEGIEQTQVSPKDGYTFASGLRAALRQDPDVILVGEIRDKETAATAIDAALTGHLVFSTLHTNSALGAIPRLLDLGVKAGSVAPAINLVIAQRLVRRLCGQCRQVIPIDEVLSRNINAFYTNLPAKAVPKILSKSLYRAGGCSQCEGGFKGRVGIFETLVLGESFDEIVAQKLSEVKMRNYARNRGLIYMQEDGVLKALSGLTTLEEVEKTTGSIKWPKVALE